MSTRISFGISGLDKMLGGGLYSGSVAIVKEAPETGKPSFGIQCIAKGIDQGEIGLYVSFEEENPRL